MKIAWYGHAAFRITTGQGVRIIIDPYEPQAFDGALSYGRIADEADIVLTSHDHADHNYVKDIRGKYALIEKDGVYEVKGVTVSALATFHDPSGGKERGKNLIFVIEADGLRVAHVGDLGHVLDKETVAKVGKVDVLLLPVGGFYTIDAGEAERVAEALKPSIVVPMHFKTEKCAFPIAPVEEFTRGKKNVRVSAASELEVLKQSLPASPEIVVLRHAL
jgi:L-ascorbate metabolism protein UlaG (beta-lactamase superfamily)